MSEHSIENAHPKFSEFRDRKLQNPAVRDGYEQAKAKRDVDPHEARGLFPVLTDGGADALQDVMTAVNGFYYPGDRSDAVASTIAWLQTHPEACASLGLPIYPPAEPEWSGDHG